MSVKVKKILLISLIFITILALIICFSSNNSTTEEPATNYVLKSYKNTVGLYRNDQLIKTYDSIVLNTLPQKDIQNFNNGIPVSGSSHAESILEDFDG